MSNIENKMHIYAERFIIIISISLAPGRQRSISPKWFSYHDIYTLKNIYIIIYLSTHINIIHAKNHDCIQNLKTLKKHLAE